MQKNNNRRLRKSQFKQIRHQTVNKDMLSRVLRRRNQRVKIESQRSYHNNENKVLFMYGTSPFILNNKKVSSINKANLTIKNLKKIQKNHFEQKLKST